MKTHHAIQLALLGLSSLSPQLSTVFAQGTAFTYEGRLVAGTNAANGVYDFQFTVYDAAVSGASVAAPITNSPIGVTNGLFVTTLDFGGGVFTGDARWLQIAVRTNGTGQFTTLSPRQKITAAPYAITANNLTGTLRAGQLVGNLAAAALPPGGNWALSSTLTLDSATLAIDPINHRVGIGTSTPTAALTVRPTGTSYGIEHTDGIRRLSTYLDVGGCYFGTVSADKLHFFVNDGPASMTVDLAGRIGVGTSYPVWPLHLVAGQGVVRLDSTANTFGSVLELRNNTPSATYLGGINFQNAAGTYPGQITYLATDDLIFRTASAERMRLDSTGRLDVRGQVQVRNSIRLDPADEPMIVRQWDPFTGGSKTGFGRWGLFMEPSSLFIGVPGSDYPFGSSIALGGWLADGTRQNWMTLTGSTNTGPVLQLINTTSNSPVVAGIVMMGQGPEESATLRLQQRPYERDELKLLMGSTEVASFHSFRGTTFTADGGNTVELGEPNVPVRVTRSWSGDGIFVIFNKQNNTVGDISVSGETVSYNAFTGSHFAWTEHTLQRGQLVRMTGLNRRLGDRPAAEIIYGVAPTMSANDPACLGAYLALEQPAQPAGSTNLHLVMSVGNGELWVVEPGGDLEPGDGLISSDVAGCAMKDDPARFAIGHVVARAAERVVWSEIAPNPDGVKRRLISVLFDRFTRGVVEAPGHQVARAAIQGLNQKLEEQRADLKQKQTEIAELKRELRELKQLVHSITQTASN